MKKVLFFIMSFLMFVSITNASINDVSFVGGTGGSRILDLTHENNRINTSGVIYDKDASLVYEITYTNDTEYNKKIADVTIPNNKKLKYKIIDLDNNKVIFPGETVKFKYSIYSADDKSFDELQSLNESAELQMSLGTVIVSNPNTVDLFFVAIFLFAFSFVCYKRFKSKKAFYAGFTIFLLVSVLARKDLVLADEKEMVQINTNIKYILSNLAPSCANTNYTGDFCIDWKTYGNRDVVNYLVTEDTKELPNTYSIGDVNFTLQSTHDVSEQQNGEVNLGVYKVDDQESYLFLIGQDGGVVVPKDASYQFSSYVSANNDSTEDFNYVTYVDFSKFYSNKTTNMSYMLTGIGANVDLVKLDLSGFETSNVTDMSYMFMGVAGYSNELEIDLSHFDTSNVTTMERMFLEVGYRSGKVKLDIYDFDTSKVINMSGMFGCYNNITVEDVYIDFFKNWDTSNVTDMSAMFVGDGLYSFFANQQYGYYDGTTYIDLEGLDTENVTDMSSMFSNNRAVIKSFDYLDTSSLNDGTSMFMSLGTLISDDVQDYDFNSLKMDNLTKASSMFSTTSVKLIDISSWNLEKLEVAVSMFNAIYAEKLVLGNHNFASLKNANSMFRANGSGVEVLDLSGCNFSNVEDYTNFLYVLPSQTTIPIIDLSGSDWNESAIVEKMFLNVVGSTIYVKDEKAKVFIEKQVPDSTVLIKEK